MDSLIPMTTLERSAAVMRVLAHPQRLRICELLLRGQVSVGGLADALAAPSNVVSQHLGMLRAHGVVQPERAGKTVYYRVIDPSPGWLLACIRDHGENRTARLGGGDGRVSTST